MAGGGSVRCTVVLAICIASAVGACKTTLRGGLTEDEANQIALALDRAQIAAAKVAAPGSGARPRFEVQVAPSDVASALRVLEHEQLPRPEPAGFAELYAEAGLVATPHEERARWAAAVAGELSRSLERIAGVVDARVHLSLPEATHALDAQPTPSKAAVLLRTLPGARPIDERSIRALLAGAVDGLSPERVTVVQVRADADRPPKRKLVQIGPISVTSGSAAVLKALLGSALLLDLLLAVALVALWRTRRLARNQTDPA